MRALDSPNVSPNRGELILFDVGYAEKRLKGEDTLLLDNYQELYGVFDGVGSGGIRSAEVAHLAASAIKAYVCAEHFNSSQIAETVIVKAMKHAQCVIEDMYLSMHANPPYGATTATIAKFTHEDGNTNLAWASVGDSRLYIKNAAGNLIQITHDEGEGRFLSNVLGINEFFEGVLQHGTIQLNESCDIVLVTDGITGDYGEDILSPDEIVHALDASSAQAAAKMLVSISRKHDDKTALVIRY